jgi:hypothetical protein
MNSATIVQKLWNYCNVLRDDGMSYGDYVEQLTYSYDELIARHKASLDIFWLKDDALADSDNLPPPDVIAQEIVDDLEAAQEQFRLIAGDLQADESSA